MTTDKATATPSADAALADESASVVSGLRRANDLLRSEGYHPEAFDFSKAANFIERAAAALRARAVPEGFVMVPVAPSNAMLDAGFNAQPEAGRDSLIVAWAVMLAASKAEVAKDVKRLF